MKNQNIQKRALIKKILLIEEQEGIQSLYKIKKSGMDYQITFNKIGEEPKEILAEEHPQLAVKIILQVLQLNFKIPSMMYSTFPCNLQKKQHPSCQEKRLSNLTVLMN